MKKAPALSITLFLNLIIILAITSGAAGQSSINDALVFEPGFVVRGEFLEFFERHDGREVFGFPITIEFKEDDRLVQYFHRGKMELHPENPPEQRVIMGPLSESLIEAEPPLAEPPSRPNSRFFPETGHSVSAAFLRYFDSRGGVDIFGYPITEMMVENNRIVQYFQNARLDWYPENLPNLRVRPGNLGEIYLDENGFLSDEGIRDPLNDQSGGIEPPQVTSLDIDALVYPSFVERNHPQTLYVFVNDQNGTPLFGAEMQSEINFPQTEPEIALTTTDELGLAWRVFDVGQIPVGETLVIDVIVRYGNIEARTQTSFYVWQ